MGAYMAGEAPQGADRRLLIIWHSRTGAARSLAQAAYAGARAHGAQLVAAEAVDAAMMHAAGGYLFVAPENLGGLSGLMKEMFDRLYYPMLGAIEGRPYATIIAAGSAGQGAEAQVDRIVTGWRLRRVMAGWIVNTAADRPETILAPKTLAPSTLAQARELGMGFAIGLETGIF